MGFVCFRCGNVVAGSSQRLIHHIRNIHGFTANPQFLYICGQDGCLRTFAHTWSFRRHLDKNHAHTLDGEERCPMPSDIAQASQGDEINDGLHESDDEDCGDDDSSNVILKNCHDDMLKKVATFISTLKQSGNITLSIVENVVRNTFVFRLDLVYRTI